MLVEIKMKYRVSKSHVSNEKKKRREEKREKQSMIQTEM